MTDDELDRLQALADAATGGPWTAATTVDEYGQRLHTMDVLPLTSFGEIEPHDAAFIAASRDAIPALIAEVRRLRWQAAERGSLLAECLMHDMRHLPSCSFVQNKEAVCDCGLYTLVGKIDRIIRERRCANGS